MTSRKPQRENAPPGGVRKSSTGRTALDELTLSGAAESYRLLIEQMNQGAATLSADGLLLYCNRRFSEFLKVPEERLVGSLFPSFVPPGERDVLDRLLRAGQTAPVTGEITVQAADGTLLPVRLAVNGLPEGSVAAVCLVASDLSDEKRREIAWLNLMEDLSAANAQLTREIAERARKEDALRASEQRLRFHVEQTPLAVIDWDVDFRVVQWNPAAERLFGYSAAEAIGRHGAFIIPEAARPQTDGVWRALLTQRGGHRNTNENLTKDGRLVICEWYNTPLLGHDGAVIGVASIGQDITDRRRAEDAIRALNTELETRVRDRTRQLEEANRELEAFSYSVSHDLRAPLRHVRGFIELLVQDAGAALSDASRRYLTIIGDASREMGVLIDDLLSFSRMGRVEMHTGRVDLTALAHECIDTLQASLLGRDVTWTIAALPQVKGDRSMLKQALFNLLDNAAKYTRPRNPAEIEVGCAGVEDGRRVFFVRDNGVGFDPAYAHKLFGVFQRLHKSDEFEGTGIGLANVRRIIARHGGRTWGEGQPGGGASFSFTLEEDRADYPTKE